ncbi:right-handed parallel beta-helix repeat-containing protein [Salinibacterium sp. ZJ450]|uniref:right-handed parallel beta-helix repeat-containing protein n=1 Tax=Salinibacterium sp. ZJ450 TaxID=2708338 RepID=UPI001422B18F|nr:right-handed parallel beta-helix repeat-containing protein [Salinibacterium sp. ZJ450]
MPATSTHKRTARLRKHCALGAVAAAAVLGVAFAPVGNSSAEAAGAVSVSSSAELTSALTSATAGDVITLEDGTYTGKFKAAASGTQAAPITLVGSPNAVLTTGSTSSGYGLHVTGHNWNITGFSVSGAQKGIVLDDSDNTVIDGVDVGSTGHEGIHLRSSSNGVTVRNSTVHDAGVVTPAIGEGIYVGTAESNWGEVMGSSSTADQSDNAVIENNRIFNTAAEGIDVKEGTTGGRVIGNSFDNAGHSGANNADSWIDIKGNGYVVADNSGTTARVDAIQVHSVRDGWGGNNTFTGNGTVAAVPGFEVNIASKTPGNVVDCKASDAAQGLTNVDCS